MALEQSSLTVVIVVNLIMGILGMILVVRTYILPQFLKGIDIKLKDTDDMMKAAASAMGLKSVEVKELKKLEKLIIKDVMAEFPEIEMLLDYVSPDTADMIRKHPERALVLYKRYKPFLDGIMGKVAEEEEPPFQF